MLLVAPNADQPGRIGLTVSRKVGNAVTRNRVRRRLREIVRLRPEELSHGWDHVVIAHPEAAVCDTRRLTEELTCLLAQARAWISANASCSR